MATDAAVTGSSIHRAQATPTKAETRLPPMIDHGWASGLSEAPNKSTADAPMGATRSGMFPAWPNNTWVARPVNAIPMSAPTHRRTRSRHCGAAGWGAKRVSHSIIAECDIGVGRTGWQSSPVLLNSNHRHASGAARIVSGKKYQQLMFLMENIIHALCLFWWALKGLHLPIPLHTSRRERLVNSRGLPFTLACCTTREWHEQRRARRQ